MFLNTIYKGKKFVYCGLCIEEDDWKNSICCRDCFPKEFPNYQLAQSDGE